MKIYIVGTIKEYEKKLPIEAFLDLNMAKREVTKLSSLGSDRLIYLDIITLDEDGNYSCELCDAIYYEFQKFNNE